MSRRINLYIACTVAAAAVAVACGLLIQPPQSTWPWLGGLLMFVLCLGFESRSVRMPGGNTVSIATIPHLAGAILLPVPLAVAGGRLTTQRRPK